GDESIGIVDLAMIWLPAAAYFDQARTIAANKDVGNFNPAVCGVLIVCNLFRVFYWLNARFSTVLLYQSLVMITAQLLLLKLCVSVTSKRQPSTVVYKSVSEYMSSFWTWPRFRHYAVFLATLVTTLAFLHSVIGKSSAYGDFLAAIALGIEASVPMPQAYANWRRKSTYGLSFVVLLSWFGGDDRILCPNKRSPSILGVWRRSVPG
ncbi:hypothetical protein BCR44DRAFT_230623, partial [Catenaria anguillulae PL171]